MEFPRGLMVILALLSLGLCYDVAGIWQGSGAMWIYIALLAGRIAAIVGVLMRNQTGWLMTVGFFLVILLLSGIGASATGVGPGNLIPLVVQGCCLVYLLMAKDEFEA